MTERELLAAARSGDQDAFRGLVEPHCSGLHAHCYRMLGSLDDAEDALQDSLVRAWRGLPRFEGRSTVRTWLYRITTHACVDALARRSRLSAVEGVRPYADDLGPADGEDVPEARYEQREAVESAFAAALQHLAPRQRVVLVLREVLGFSAKEVSHSLGTTVTSVNSALQRAHKAVDDRVSAEGEQITMRSLEDRRVRESVQRFVDAFERRDVDAIVATSGACHP
jgi:RNA polymerase sigma-70 factor (ECF subfamily)